MNDLLDPTDKEVLQYLGAQRILPCHCSILILRIYVLTLPMQFGDNFDIEPFVYRLFFRVVQVYQHISQT